MEILDWFKNSSDGNGDGNGDGYGDGDGHGYGHGHGHGHGNGYGDGNGHGDGNGNGYGYGYSSGNGNGSGCRLTSVYNRPVHYIDAVPTLVYHIKGAIAKGAIISDKDYTLAPCFIAKSDNGLLAHGETVRAAIHALERKVLQRLDTADKHAEFKKRFAPDQKYPAREFSEWHFLLTGSCQFGREQFAKQEGIDLKNDKLTPYEFLQHAKNQYGWDAIKDLHKTYRLSREHDTSRRTP